MSSHSSSHEEVGNPLAKCQSPRVDSTGMANAIRLGTTSRNMSKTKRSGRGARQNARTTSSSQVDGLQSNALASSNKNTQPNRNSSALKISPNNQVIQASIRRDTNLITECANFWSILCFIITSFHTGIMIFFAWTKDKKYNDFYSNLFLPTCTTATAISFYLKPRRTDMMYKVFLYSQYFIITFVGELCVMWGFNWDLSVVWKRIPICIIWVLLFLLTLELRAKTARLPDSELSEFLTISVLKGGILVGLGQVCVCVRERERESFSREALILRARNHC